MLFFSACDWDMSFSSTFTVKHPVQTLLEEAAKQEPSLEDILVEWQYSKQQIEHPLLVNAFQPNGDVLLTWIAKYTPKQLQIGWEQRNQLHPLLMTDSIMNIPTPLNTSDEPIGLFVMVKDEKDLTYQMDDKESCTRVYPLIKKGEIVESSFLICWEVDGDNDFNDVIMQLDGVDAIQK